LSASHSDSDESFREEDSMHIDAEPIFQIWKIDKRPAALQVGPDVLDSLPDVERYSFYVQAFLDAASGDPSQRALEQLASFQVAMKEKIKRSKLRDDNELLAWARLNNVVVDVPPIGLPVGTVLARDTKSKSGDEGPARLYRLRADHPNEFAKLVERVYYGGDPSVAGLNKVGAALPPRCGKTPGLVRLVQSECWVRLDLIDAKPQHNLSKPWKRRIDPDGIKYGVGGFKAHVVMAVLFALLPPMAGDQASHLCGSARCLNPWHIVIESAWANMLRRECRARGLCLGHHGGPACIF